MSNCRSRSPKSGAVEPPLHPAADREQHDREQRREQDRRHGLERRREQQGGSRDAGRVHDRDEQVRRALDALAAIARPDVERAVPQDPVDRGDRDGDHRRVDEELDAPEAGAKVHSANATMASADGEGHDASASAHLRRTEDRAGREHRQAERDCRPRLEDEVVDRGRRPLEPRHDVRIGDRLAADADELRHHDVRGREQGERADEHRDPEEDDGDPLPPPLGHAVGEGREDDRSADVATASAVRPITLKSGNHGSVRISGLQMHEGLVRRSDEHRGRPERDEHGDPGRRHREQPHAEHEQRQRTEQRPRESVVGACVDVDEPADDDDVRQVTRPRSGRASPGTPTCDPRSPSSSSAGADGRGSAPTVA